ncbi:MAG TPA: hypothetical protein VJC17_01075 [Candidatus Dojkabacteria bacterium]|nr:hypothetical protein [Candidatus Dojkabacteria bacterium]
MNVDDIVKLALAFALLFAIVGIAYELMKLISSLTDNVKGMSKIVSEMGELSGKLVKDYDYVSEQIKFIIGTLSAFVKKVLVPLTGIFGIVGKFANFGRKKQEKETEEETDESVSESQ